MKICLVDGCHKEQIARGWCHTHYKRWQVHGDPLHVEKTMPPRGSPKAFIEAMPSSGDECVVWPYMRNNMGYAMINNGDGTKSLVSRVVCGQRNGPPPTPEHQAAHSCGKGHDGCVAPWHLSWKTQKENRADTKLHGTHLFGSMLKTSKLSEIDVFLIKSLLGVAPQSYLSKTFGVTQSAISKIKRGGLWAHIE